MGASLSAVWLWPSVEGVIHELQDSKADPKGKQKAVAPAAADAANLTLQYPPQEADFLRKVQQEEEERAKAEEEAAADEEEDGEPQVDLSMLTPEERRRKKASLKSKRRRRRMREMSLQRQMQAMRKIFNPAWEEQLDEAQRESLQKAKRINPDRVLAEYIVKYKHTMVICPNRHCGMVFEKNLDKISDPRPLPHVFGLDGKPLSGNALEHFYLHRFRCHNCSLIFCSKCGALPYHVGETCDEFKLRASRKVCKVCVQPLPPAVDEAAKKEVACFNADCRKMVYNLCPQNAACGHPCNGTRHQDCFCLKPACATSKKIMQLGTDLCGICFTDELERGTCIMLKCGHVFHRNCVEQKLKHRWSAARISFHFANCPLCQKPIEVVNDYSISALVRNIADLHKELKLKGLHFLKVEGMLDDVKDPSHKFHDNPSDYALDVFSFYLCSKCQTPYYGGKRRCGDVLNFNPDELVCGGCSGLVACAKHGKRYIHYKCRFCCNIASWFCFGLVHYCETCHNNPYQYWASNNSLASVPPQCGGKNVCPLSIDHPPNGFEEMSLGCSRCKLEEAGMVMEEDPEGGDYEEDLF